MNYEEIENDMLPQAVWDEMFALIKIEPEALVEKVLSWNRFYGRWAILCRRRTEEDRLLYIKDGTFNRLAEQVRANDDEEAGTLLTTLWCMPDVFLDDVIKIRQAAEAM